MNSTKKHTPLNAYAKRNLKRLPWLADLAPVHRPFFHGAFHEPKKSITISSAQLTIQKHDPRMKIKRRKPLGKISLFLYVRFGSRAVPELK